MVKVKDMMEKGLSAVRDLADFFKETARNRKKGKGGRSSLPEAKTFNGIPLRDYCWLRDEIFRTETERKKEEGEQSFVCKAVMMLSLAFLAAGLGWIYAGIFPAFLSFVALSGMILEMDLEKEVKSEKFLMSFPEQGIWNSGEIDSLKWNFQDAIDVARNPGGTVQGKEFEKIFAMAGIDFEKSVYKIEEDKANFLLNIFYGLNDWETVKEMIYDISSGEFTAEELFRRRNELCSLEKNFVKKGRLKFRKRIEHLELERKEIDGKVYWIDEKGYIKIPEEFSELTTFNRKDIRDILKYVYPSAEKISNISGERWLEKGYVQLEENGRRKHLIFEREEWKKLDGNDMEEEDN